MANDRIKITCKKCSESMTFAKYYPTIGHGIWDEKSLSDFVHKHMQCSPAFGGMDLDGDRCFDLSTDSENAVVDKP